MADDFRVALDFLDHPKTVRLKSLVGAEGVFCLMRLWAFAGNYRPRGMLSGMKVDDIAIAAKWTEDVDLFVTALIESRFLDKLKNGVYRLHNWKLRQGYLYHKPERRERARKGGKARQAKVDNNLRSAKKKIKYTPSPTPSPAPSPTPSPAPIAIHKQLRSLYIKICQGFPEPTKVSDWSQKRKGNVNARWKLHPDIDWWRTYFESVAVSDFLRNGNESWGGADFGWIILPSNMEKILEGRYDNKKQKTEIKYDRPTGEFD